MKKKIKYTDEPVKLGKTLPDFLPSPAELAKQEETARITINLKQSSVEFFKNQAEKTGIPYQKLIRSVIDEYASHYG